MTKSRKARAPAADAFARFMERAYRMELEASERYAQFAEQLETHNNREVAELFRKLSGIEALHAKRILDEMRWPSMPAMPVPYASEGELPETAPFESVHYLMQPYHALEIALRCELRAAKYFEQIAAGSGPQPVRAAASEMAGEEREHVRLVRDWMKRVPRPAEGWDEDPDPPALTE